MENWYLKTVVLMFYTIYTILRIDPSNFVNNLNFLLYGAISSLLYYIFEKKSKLEFINSFEKIDNQRFLLEEIIPIPIVVISKGLKIEF